MSTDKEFDSLQPISLAKTEDRKLEIEWNDGVIQQISFKALREGCPCATCREKAASSDPQTKQNSGSFGLPVLSAAEARPLEIVAMKPVGNYAYHVNFSDGHATGIYPFRLLRELGSR